MYKISASVIILIIYSVNSSLADCVLKSDYDYFNECYNDGTCEVIINVIKNLCVVLNTNVIELNYVKMNVKIFCKKDINDNKSFIRLMMNSEKIFSYDSCIGECKNTEYVGKVYPECIALKSALVLLEKKKTMFDSMKISINKNSIVQDSSEFYPSVYFFQKNAFFFFNVKKSRSLVMRNFI